MTRAARYVLFIRNVMLGRGGLTRDLLTAAISRCGGQDPRSYLTTGNVTFSATPQTMRTLPNRFGTALTEILSRSEPTFIRSLAELETLADHVSFPDDAGIHERCVTFLPVDQRWEGALPLARPRGDVTITRAWGPQVLSVTRLVRGRPGTAGPLIERALRCSVTTRNWNTVERILRSPG